MAKLTTAEVTNALKNTVDPEIGINVVDLGLLYDIKISETNDVDIKLTMTSPMCPVTSVIMADVQLRLENVSGVGKVSLDLVWEPAWNPEMISEEYRVKMGA